MAPPTTLPSTAMPQGETGDRVGAGPGDSVGAGPGNTALPHRVWLYVDDQLQQMKPHRGPRPRPQPEQPLLLGGLPESSTVQNFSGCIRNVFVQR